MVVYNSMNLAATQTTKHCNSIVTMVTNANKHVMPWLLILTSQPSTLRVDSVRRCCVSQWVN